MRKMALDYGEVRIGIAFSDILNIIANGYETYTRKNLEADLDYLNKLVKEKEVDTIVLGLPINMDGTEGERAIATRQFGDLLANKTGLVVKYLDERLTSASAERMLIEADMRREKRKQVIDKISATIILQNYLDIYSK
ncbi:MAG: Holliday junction resolvase RuvX [Clostridia bacterium]|nr:Holliday junction resolvase RuvX [Clostridia bacterium]